MECQSDPAKVGVGLALLSYNAHLPWVRRVSERSGDGTKYLIHFVVSQRSSALYWQFHAQQCVSTEIRQLDEIG